MPAPTNAFKAALRTDDVQVGTWLGFADAYVAEAAATADFDWFRFNLTLIFILTDTPALTLPPLIFNIILAIAPSQRTAP